MNEELVALFKDYSIPQFILEVGSRFQWSFWAAVVWLGLMLWWLRSDKPVLRFRVHQSQEHPDFWSLPVIFVVFQAVCFFIKAIDGLGCGPGCGLGLTRSITFPLLDTAYAFFAIVTVLLSSSFEDRGVVMDRLPGVYTPGYIRIPLESVGPSAPS